MNAFDPDNHHRRSIRLKNYDYSQPGAYFITICTKDRECLFGDPVGANGVRPVINGVRPVINGVRPVSNDVRPVSNGVRPVINGVRPASNDVRPDSGIILNEYGTIVREEWLRTPEIRREITLDEYVVMPNHFHAIVLIADAGAGDRQTGRGDRPVAPTGVKSRSIGALMAGYKSIVTKRINTLRRTPGFSVWQRNYYEHIIRNEAELNQIRQYIIDNPMMWASDRDNPEYK